MDESEIERAQAAEQIADHEPAPGEAQAEADRAADSLRDQIAALRRQVKDAQDTLRGHERRREEGGGWR